MSAAPEFVGFEAMRMFAGEVDNAIAALPPQPSEEDVESVAIIMDAYLQMGEWTEDQRERLCAAARRQLLEKGKLA